MTIRLIHRSVRHTVIQSNESTSFKIKWFHESYEFECKALGFGQSMCHSLFFDFGDNVPDMAGLSLHTLTHARTL